MKKICSILLILLTTCLYAQEQSQKATVYLLRSIGHDLDQYVPYYTYMDTVLLCVLGEERYSVHEVNPGEHKLHVQYKGKIKSTPETDLTVNLEPGKTYYFSVNLKTRPFGKGSFYCEQLPEEEGKKRAEAFLLVNRCF